MDTCVNGWPVIHSDRTTGDLPRLRRWIIPTNEAGPRRPGTRKPAPREVLLRDGSAGFLLVHMALWWHERLEPINQGQLDEWGWYVRPVRGQSTGYSNHSGGVALDINATQHPHHVPLAKTFVPSEVAAIRERLKLYAGLLGWGGDWRPENVDGMHVELAPGTTLAQAERVARRLVDSPRGKRIIMANPGAAKIIGS